MVFFFKNKNNFDPVLKDELLRSIITIKNDHNQQNPVVGLQKPQKYCLIPGLMSTEKSNLSEDLQILLVKIFKVFIFKKIF